MWNNLDWKTITNSRDPKYKVKGTSLAYTLYGPNSRFKIIEVRTMYPSGTLGTKYVVKDAETVSDAEVKAGVEPKIIGESELLTGAMELCKKVFYVKTPT